MIQRRVLAAAHETVRERGPAAVRIHLRTYCQVLDHLIFAVGIDTTSMVAKGLMIKPWS